MTSPRRGLWRGWSGAAIVLYSGLALSCLALALSRLSLSTELPGLAALELVLMAVPWSLLLGHPPVAHGPLAISAAVVLLGVVINGVLVAGLVRGAERSWRRRQSTSGPIGAR